MIPSGSSLWYGDIADMDVRIVVKNSVRIAAIDSSEVIIFDGQTALDCAATVFYEHDCQTIVINKAAITDDFFNLSTGVAGEVAQKFVNYRFRLAIIGDFSGYTSKPLHDFIYESNRGRHLLFLSDEDTAIDKLSAMS